LEYGSFGSFSPSRILALMIGFVITRLGKNYHLTHTDTRRNKMSESKNPYELRFDVLSMAKEMMDRQYDLAVDATHMAMEKFGNAQTDPIEFFKEYAPKMYQPKEVLGTARELYTFISEKR
jgi:hypothetical protein